MDDRDMTFAMLEDGSGSCELEDDSGGVLLEGGTPGRQFSAPTITSEHTVDAGIDATGATDVTAALNSWVAAQPNGSRLIFPPGSTYLLATQSLQIANRTDLEFVGDGCTLDSTGGYEQLNGNIVLGHEYGAYWGGLNQRIQIHGFNLVNHNANPGQYDAAEENCPAIEVAASSAVQIWDITAEGIYGDFLWVVNSTDVWMHDSHATDVGRMALFVEEGTWVAMDYCTVDAYGYYALDVEPNAEVACTDVFFRHNTTGKGTSFGGFAAVGSGTMFSEIARVHVTDNVIVDNDAYSILQCYYNQNQHHRLTDIEFSRNTSVHSGGTAQFKSCDRLTVIGNTAAGSALTLDIIDCTNVVTT